MIYEDGSGRPVLFLFHKEIKMSSDTLTDAEQRSLTALFDGELAGNSAEQAQALLAGSAAARAWWAELEAGRAALAHAHRLPDGAVPRWGDVSARPVRPSAAFFRKVSPFPVLLGGLAAALALGLALWWPGAQTPPPEGFMTEADAYQDMISGTVELLETDLVDAVPIVFLDQPSGWTVIWILEAEEAGDI